MKKAARDQLPHVESDGNVELGDSKMADGPEREPGQQPWAGYRFKRENSDVCADQQSCESRHENSLTGSGDLHTKNLIAESEEFPGLLAFLRYLVSRKLSLTMFM